MATMAALLKSSSSSSSYCTNQSPNRRFIITPPLAPTRISFPINRRVLLFTPLTQNPLPEITTKCSSSRGSTFMEEEEEDHPAVPFGILKEVKKTLKAVKGLEKPAVVAILVWVLLTKNPTIAYSSSSRTAFFGGVWFVYDVCKAIATARRIDDDGSIRFYLGRVLGSTVLLSSGFMLLLLLGFLLFVCGLLAVILLLTAAYLGMVVGFGKVTWPSLMEDDESVNTTDEPEEEEY